MLVLNNKVFCNSLAAVVFLLAVTGVYCAEKPTEEVELTLEPECALLFKDNAVLQRGIKLPVWGTSLPGAKITVTFDDQVKSTVAGKDGEWWLSLDPMSAAKLASVNDCPAGKTMKISAAKSGRQETVEIKNLIVGDVWLCAGQSNMAGSLRRAGHPKNYPSNTVANADYPALRIFGGAEDGWLICSPETVVRCSRTAFFFVRRLQRDALVPIGLMVSAVGGSNIESWLNEEPYEEGKNYKRLIAPFVGYGLKGAVWYQGESNARDKRKYQPKLESLITGWRKAWAQGDFPFYYVQLPGIGGSTLENPAGGDGRAEIRQAYVEALRLKNTGLVVTIDVGAPHEHPPNKYDTGVRLARLALHNDYGFKDLGICPLYNSHKVEGNTVRIFFENAKSGLMIAEKEGFLPPKPLPDGKLEWVSIQGADGNWHWAEGEIDGSDLIVSCKDVKEPKAVRYAYTQNPCGRLLYNKDGQPVSPFTTCGYDFKIERK